MTSPPTEPLAPLPEYSDAERLVRIQEFTTGIRRRRTVRDFSDRPVDRAIIEQAIVAAGGAPNGANLQPWHFVAVQDPELKRAIRLAAEEEEREFYSSRATPEWIEDLAPLGTDADKPFLERAPWLIAIFAEKWRQLPNGARRTNYYVPESVGIATGFLIAALHHAGLATLTHTPSPMGFLQRILERPPSEKLSGVTFSTPITRVRRPSSSVRPSGSESV